MSFTRIKIISLLLFTVFALFMFLVFRTYIVEKQHNGVDVNIINTKQYIEKSITYLINEKKLTYLNTSKIIFSDTKIINALKNKNRKKFYEHIKTYHDRIQKRDENFWGLHIILPNNMSFIRVHKPHVSDKIIAKGKKPLIDKVNETQKEVTSFDAGKFGYFLRVVTPIFSSDKEYLGVAEFSVSVDSLTQHIKNKFGYEGLFLVKNSQNKEFLNLLPKTKDGLTIFKLTNEKLFSDYQSQKSNTDDSFDLHDDFIKHKNKIFTTTTIELSSSAFLVIAFDITNIIKEQRIFENNVTSLTTLVIFIFSIIWFFSTKLYLKNKIQIDSQLQKSHKIISENVLFSNTDLNGVITDVSDAFCHASGYTRGQLIGSPHSIVRHPDTKDSTYDDLWSTLKENKVWKGELKNLKSDGSYFWIETTISPRFDESHNKIGYMSIKQNITNRKIIETNSITDSLCGIYNRRHFDDIFQNIINIAKRKNETICFLIMDVDYFKQYNDTYGHQMGDEALKNISKSLKHSLQRGDDYCFRLGGEEFGIIFRAENKQEALNFANTIKENIEKLKIIHSTSEVSDYITASFGVVYKHANDIKNADEIYKDADDLLYKAKNTVRNTVIINT